MSGVSPTRFRFNHDDPVTPAVTETLNTAEEFAGISDVAQETVES